MLFFLSIYAFGMIGFLVHALRLPIEQVTRSKLVELFLLYQIVFNIGLTSLVAFFGLTFMSEYIADYTGWPACPFEQQLANVNLAFGCLGFLAIWYRNDFWTATVLGFSIWIFCDGLQHLTQYVHLENSYPGNIGVPLWTDFLVPILLVMTLFLHKSLNNNVQP